MIRIVTCLIVVMGSTATSVAQSPEVTIKEGQPTVKVGVLHSLTGTMAISETSLRDALLMSMDEINENGGIEVNGKSYQIDPIVVDPASNWDLFAEKAKTLLTEHEVKVVFGCWTSASRKSVLPVFEQYNGLLFYPVQYEGQEASPNIFYTGATPNQQLLPAAKYMLDQGYEKFYLLGTDYVFPRTANRVLKAYLKAQGIPEENIREEYVPFGFSDYQTIVGKIEAFAEDGQACVMSTINGDSNVPFYKELANQGVSAFECPVMAFSVAEDALRSMPTRALVGHLATWNYFQSLDTSANEAFVKQFKQWCAEQGLPGGKSRVTSDPIEGSYFGVKVWAKAAEKADSFAVDKVREAVRGMKFTSPGGQKKMHAENNHTYKRAYVGEIQPNGQFRVMWKSDGLIEPKPFTKYLKNE
jgi:urea transport system substrate-binding protein